MATLTDEKALGLINELLGAIGPSQLSEEEEDALTERNSSILERAYGKEEGFVSDLIFYEDITEDNVLLNRLKEDTTIKL